MALTISNVATAASTTSGATLDITGVTASVGDWLVLAVAADNAGTSGASSLSTSITDAAGNVWTHRATTNYTPGGAAGDGTTLGIFTAEVTHALSSATLTVNFSPNTTAKAAALKKVVPGAGEIVVFHSVGSGATGNGTSFAAPTVSVDALHTIFGWTALESTSIGSNDSDTTNGSWSSAQTAAASTGTAATSQYLAGQHKTVTASGSQTYDTTAGNARDWAANYLILYPALLAPLAATEAADTMAAAGEVYWPATLAATEAADTMAVTAEVYWPATLAATETADRAAFVVRTPRATSIRILVQFDWPTSAVSRLWDGSGPFVDFDGNVWKGCSLTDGIADIEMAINGEAAALDVALMGVGAPEADAVWLSYTNEQIVGAVVRIMIQPCDDEDQPVDDREIMFTGRIDNVVFDDAVVDDRPVSTITAEVTNRFTLRRLENGGVLSDTDQRARSAAVNPEEETDRFCERVPGLEDKTVAWPKWRS